MTGVVNCVQYADGRRVGDVEISEIGAVVKNPDSYIWIGLHEPGEDLLREVQQQLGLHDLAIEDAHRAHQRPKMEIYGESLFIVLRTAHLNASQGTIDLGETHFFVGSNYLVSIRHGFALSYAQVRERAESTPQLLSKGLGFVLYAVMDFVVDQYFPVMEELEDKLEAIEEKIFGESTNRETTGEMYELKRTLLEMKRAVSPLTEICNRLMRLDLPLIREDIRPYYRDVSDHVSRINERVDTMRELLSTVLDANLSLISVSQSEAMKKLAAWAAIIAVPTMVAGIYGMNFQFMPELHWRFGYPMILGLTIAICGYLFFRFKRAEWL